MPVSVLERAAGQGLSDYDPGLVIDAVNALWPMGKDGSLTAIERLLTRIQPSTQGYGVFWVLRVLFDPPAGQIAPPVQLGTADIPPPPDPTALPRFPIVIIRDIPFLVVGGYVIRGLVQSPEAHIDYFRHHGMLRAASLRPPLLLDGVAEEFWRTWITTYGEAYRHRILGRIAAQLTRFDASRTARATR
jgi:hypothetical protein